MRKTIIIEGNNISDVISFYNEINRVFMQNEDWKLGNSLDALNDLFYGGYGEIKGKESVELIWKDISKSKSALGYEATKAFYEEKLANPGTYNVKWAEEKLAELERNEGETYFDIVLGIVKDHPNIELLQQ